MKPKLFIYILLASIFLASCSGGASGPTPAAVDIGLVQTHTVQTVIAPLTQTAAAYTPPTATATVIATEAPIATPVIDQSPTPAQSPIPESTATETPCDDLQFINDTSFPDGTTMTPNQQFVKTWKVKNIGACTWTTGYSITFAYGDKLNGQDTALTSEVLPKTETEVSITLTAPAKTGTYSGYWTLKNNNGYVFGTKLSVVIVVP